MEIDGELLAAVNDQLDQFPRPKSGDLGLDPLEISEMLAAEYGVERKVALEAIKRVAAQRGIPLLL